MGIPFEKKYIQFSEDDIEKIMQLLIITGNKTIMKITIKIFLNFVTVQRFEEVAKKDFSLVPSKYIEFVNRDENIDFDEKMKSLQTEFAELLES